MPRNPTTTKEDIIEGAFQLIREQGHEALTVRNLASFLGCSTQPVMYQFPSMDALRDLTYQRADAFHSAYILAAEDLLGIGLRYIRFAGEEPQLFRFLFQSGRFSGLFEPLVALVHGYASLIANNTMTYDPDAIRTTLLMIAEGLERKESP